MLSSALKHGSTDHLPPHPRQLSGDAKLGVPALDWTKGDTLGNIQSMIDVSVASLTHYVPEIANARYDFDSRTFRTGQGKPLSDEALDKWASTSPRSRAARVGSASIKRGILLNSLAQAEGSARDGLLEQALRQPDQLVGEAARGTFYSRSDFPDMGEGLTPCRKARSALSAFPLA